MASMLPVFLDGPLSGEQVSVSDAQVSEGIFAYRPQREHDDPGVTEQVIYTFTKVQVFGRTVVVASVAGGLPTMDELWDRLVTSDAKAAVSS